MIRIVNIILTKFVGLKVLYFSFPLFDGKSSLSDDELRIVSVTILIHPMDLGSY